MLSDRCPVCLSVCNVRALWRNAWTDQDETWHAGRPRSWPHFVRWGPSSPSLKGVRLPQFSAHTCCGQMAARIKMPLGMQLGRPRRLCVRWGSRSPSLKMGRSPPNFRLFIGPNGWMDQDGTWHGDRPQPRGLCVRWGPSPPLKFSADVYYSYCDFVRTLRSCYWFFKFKFKF